MENKLDGKSDKIMDHHRQEGSVSACTIEAPGKRQGIRPLFITARLILGVVFLYAGFDKILHPAAFADVIVNYRILPDVLTNLTAVVLPWLEFFLGLALLLGVWLPGAVFLCNLLLVIFLGTLVFNLARGLNVYCGCFDTNIRDGSHAPMAWYVIRDALFLVPGIYLFRHVIGVQNKFFLRLPF